MKRRPRSLKAWYYNKDVISVYELVRCYGGPEEGGWWYDHWEKVCTHIAPKKISKDVEIALMREYKYNPNYDRVNAEDCYVVVNERYPGENATRRRPIYC